MADSKVGARRLTNMRYNIFVIITVSNSVAERQYKGVDITAFDAEKCFNKGWAKEFFNDMYDNGLKNDKLALIFKENISVKVPMTTLEGETKLNDISENTTRGTVWGSLCRTCTMEELGQQMYSIQEGPASLPHFTLL